MNQKQLQKLASVYANSKKSAEMSGLVYIDPEQSSGFSRQKKGKGFSYYTTNKKLITDDKEKERLESLAIPPAWVDVWIAPKKNFHIQATGRDEAGRKQYIYHPDWRTQRNTLNFYRLLLFGKTLPRLRKIITHQLKKEPFTKEFTLALAVALIDETAIRIGHEVYFSENDSVGLTTLRKEHIHFSQNEVHLIFTGKSGVDQDIIITKKNIQSHLKALQKLSGEHLFQYKKETGEIVPLTADDINAFLSVHSEYDISAKDFRTWNGTLTCFESTIKKFPTQGSDTTAAFNKTMKEIVQDAATLLGNTPTVAKKHYIHADLLQSIQDETFFEYYKKCRNCGSIAGLKKTEAALLKYLEILFEESF